MLGNRQQTLMSSVVLAERPEDCKSCSQEGSYLVTETILGGQAMYSKVGISTGNLYIGYG